MKHNQFQLILQLILYIYLQTMNKLYMLYLNQLFLYICIRFLLLNLYMPMLRICLYICNQPYYNQYLQCKLNMLLYHQKYLCLLQNPCICIFLWWHPELSQHHNLLLNKFPLLHKHMQNMQLLFHMYQRNLKHNHFYYMQQLLFLMLYNLQLLFLDRHQKPIHNYYNLDNQLIL